jgi:hypothetical protein
VFLHWKGVVMLLACEQPYCVYVQQHLMFPHAAPPVTFYIQAYILMCNIPANQ